MSKKTASGLEEFETRKEQEERMLHLLRIGTDFDYGIRIKNGAESYYVKELRIPKEKEGQTIRYIKEFETRTEQEKLMLHLLRVGIEFDHGIKTKNGVTRYYVKAFY